MAQEKKRKNIIYKRAEIVHEDNSLQKLLEKALSKEGTCFKASDRREHPNPDQGSVRFINRHTMHSGMFFGQLIFFEPGRSQTYIELDDDADTYTIDALTPESLNDTKSKEQKRKEFVESMLYFGVYENHLVLLQSTALKSRDLEAHLAWLLGTRTESLKNNSALILKDKPTEETLKRIVKSPVKSVHLGTPVETFGPEQSESKLDEGPSGTGFTKAVKWIPKGIGADLIKAALGEDWLNSLKLEDALDEANLQVNLEITYLRKTTSTGQKMLDNIASSLRHIEPDDVKIELNGGGLVKGNDLKLTGPISVQYNNGLIDESDLYSHMHSWLLQKIEQDEIDLSEIDSDSTNEDDA